MAKFEVNRKMKERKVESEIAQLLMNDSRLRPQGLTASNRLADKFSMECLKTECLNKIICHIDMDSFYASIEMRDRPELRGKPIAVGSQHMLCTANYKAREYGVKSAMPGYLAKEKCPDLEIVPGDMAKYSNVSEQIFKVLRRYDRDLDPAGLDEAYLDLTPLCSERDPEDVVSDIRNAVLETVNLTCSAGIAPNKMLAKVSSDWNKPNGQYRIPNDRSDVAEFLKSLHVKKIPGIGPVMQKKLLSLGISMCGQLVEERARLWCLFSRNTAEFLVYCGLGLGAIATNTVHERKSVGTESSFIPTADRGVLKSMLLPMVDEVTEWLTEHNTMAKTFTLCYKDDYFRRYSKSKSVGVSLSNKSEIAAVIYSLFDSGIARKRQKTRLLGVRASNFVTRTDMSSSFTTFFRPEMDTRGYVPDSGVETIVGDEPSVSGDAAVDGTSNVIDNVLGTSEDYGNTLADNTYEKCGIIDEKTYDGCICANLVGDAKIPQSSFFENCSNTSNMPTSTTNPIIHRTAQLNETRGMSLEGLSSDYNARFCCPVCQEASFVTMSSLEEHIEWCLNRDAINEAVKQSEQELYCGKPMFPVGPSSRQVCFKVNSVKKRRGSVAASNVKKQKTILGYFNK